MIGPFEIAAIAIIGSFVSKMYRDWLKAKKGGGKEKIQELEHRIAALESGQNVNALEERVHVLESIVTTEEFEVKQRFRELDQGEK